MSKRPATVPEEAYWDDDENEWVVAQRDEQENFHGQVKYYRPDGSLSGEVAYSHGTPHGKFCRYHEDGQPSRSGEFVEGKLHGTNVFTRSSEETTELFPHDGGGNAWYAEMDYEMDSITDARLYDRERKRIMEDGSPFPEERPAGVPERATFRKSEDDDGYHWVEGQVKDNNDGTIERQGVWRHWSPEGVLQVETPYVEGKKQGVERHFDEEGRLVSEATYVENEKLGPYMRRMDEGDMADASITIERGSYGAGESPVGLTEWLDGDDKVVARVDRGEVTENDALIEVLDTNAEADFVALGAAMKERGQVVAQILALTRALARGGEQRALEQAIAAVRPPLSEPHAGALFESSNEMVHHVMRFGGEIAGFCTLLGSIRFGTPAADILRRGAAILDDFADSRVAAELMDAAVALAPERKDFEFTHALINMSLGEPQKAKACIEALREHDEDQAEGMAGYLAALYPKYEFWRANDERARVALEAPPEEEVSLERSRDDFVWLIQACATRVETLRDALIEALDGKAADWLVPALPQLLPQGRVELDDVAQVDIEGGIVRLNHRVRAEWDRLCWACWLAGMDELALPAAEHESRELPRLITMFNSWRWIAQGYAHHGGVEPEDEVDERLVASEWFGTPITELWNAVADFITKDNDELMKTLLWLAGKEIPSPFGSDDDEEEEDE